MKIVRLKYCCNGEMGQSWYPIVIFLDYFVYVCSLMVSVALEVRFSKSYVQLKL